MGHANNHILKILTIMKINVLLLTALILLSVCKVKADNNSCPIIPAPQYSQKVASQFQLSSKTRVFFNKELSSEAFFLQHELLKNVGVSVTLCDDHNNIDAAETKIILELSQNGQDYNSDEAFSMTMSEDQVRIVARENKGIFYGLISFMHLTRLSLNENNMILVDCWNMKDQPRFEWRGFMLDESRHFFGKEKVKQLLDWMALYKLNKFHWHLTDSQGWRIEIKQYPKLTVVGGIGNFYNPYAEAQFYTQEEIKEIVRYAKERFIEIIPEIDMPGHASAANRAYPEYSGGGSKAYPDFTFNPGKEEVYAYLTNILREVDALFPSQMIHLGGDEVRYGNNMWGSNEDIQNLMKREGLEELVEVEHYFFERMSDSLFNMNNKLIAWDEVADINTDPEKTIVYFWRQNRLEQLQKSLDKGYPIVMCPRLPMYLDYAQDSLQVHGVAWERFGVNSYDKIYNYTPFNYDVNYPEGSRILGIQANIWTERVITENRLDYLVFPRIAALAESAWTEEANKNLDDFNRRLKKQFELYKEDKVYYYDPFNPRNTGEPTH